MDGAHERKEGDGDQGGPGEGQDDLPPDAELGAAVDAGGVEEFVGDREVELPQEEDEERGTERRWQDKRSESVVKAER